MDQLTSEAHQIWDKPKIRPEVPYETRLVQSAMNFSPDSPVLSAAAGLFSDRMGCQITVVEIEVTVIRLRAPIPVRTTVISRMVMVATTPHTLH